MRPRPPEGLGVRSRASDSWRGSRTPATKTDGVARRLLHGRRSECEALDRLLEYVRAGQSQVLVVRGEAGVGKTALLRYLSAESAGCRVARAVGVESEMELAYAGLHQLCAPFLDRLGRQPDPQGASLRTAFGWIPGSRRISFSLAWPCSTCCLGWRKSARSSALSMTCIGRTGRRRRRLALSRAGC